MVSSLIPDGVPEIVNWPVDGSYKLFMPGGEKSHVIIALVAPRPESITTSLIGTPSQTVWLIGPLFMNNTGLGITVIVPV